MMITAATYISILIGVGSLAWGYAQVGLDPLARWFLYFGAAWLFARSQRWWWFSALGLILAVLISALGMWFGIPPGWMLSSAIFALIAWDLTDFRRRIMFERSSGELRELARRRIARVTLLAMAGMIMSSMMMLLIRSPFTAEWILLLAVVYLLGILQVFMLMRKR